MVHDSLAIQKILKLEPKRINENQISLGWFGPSVLDVDVVFFAWDLESAFEVDNAPPNADHLGKPDETYSEEKDNLWERTGLSTCCCWLPSTRHSRVVSILTFSAVMVETKGNVRHTQVVSRSHWTRSGPMPGRRIS